MTATTSAQALRLRIPQEPAPVVESALSLEGADATQAMVDPTASTTVLPLKSIPFPSRVADMVCARARTIANAPLATSARRAPSLARDPAITPVVDPVVAAAFQMAPASVASTTSVEHVNMNAQVYLQEPHARRPVSVFSREGVAATAIPAMVSTTARRALRVSKDTTAQIANRNVPAMPPSPQNTSVPARSSTLHPTAPSLALVTTAGTQKMSAQATDGAPMERPETAHVTATKDTSAPHAISFAPLHDAALSTALKIQCAVPTALAFVKFLPVDRLLVRSVTAAQRVSGAYPVTSAASATATVVAIAKAACANVSAIQLKVSGTEPLAMCATLDTSGSTAC